MSRSNGVIFVDAPAKINLFLHVGERRADGYHDLESLVAFAEFGDRVGVAPDDGLSLTLTGPFGRTVPADAENLALKAARSLTSGRGARITLEKNIPVAAGLGGGSADAAAVLLGLNRLWSLDLDSSTLRALAASLGADVPVCIESNPAWMEGRGERVTSLPRLPQLWLLLVNPCVAVPTSSVFSGLRRRSGLGLSCPFQALDDLSQLLVFLRSTTNDLEEPARAIAPVIGEVLDELEALPGVLLARMSGSGATCFGTFADQGAARSGLLAMRAARPQWWSITTPLKSRSSAL